MPCIVLFFLSWMGIYPLGETHRQSIPLSALSSSPLPIRVAFVAPFALVAFSGDGISVLLSVGRPLKIS